MSTLDESVLQTVSAPPVEAPTVQALHNQPGHTVWFLSVEALKLPQERRLPFQAIKAKSLVGCIDFKYPDINPSVEVFANSAFDVQPLALHTKTAYSVADELRTFAGQRGGVIFEELLDAEPPTAVNVWKWLFPQGLTTDDGKGGRRGFLLAELLENLPAPDVDARTAATVLLGFGGNSQKAKEILDATRSRVEAALTEAIAYRTQLLDWLLRDAERTNSRVILRDAERDYFVEAGLEVPDDATSAAREDEKAEIRGAAMGAEIGDRIAESQGQTLAIVSEAMHNAFAPLVEGMRSSRQQDEDEVAKLRAELAELKALVKGGNNAETESRNADGTKAANGGGQPSGGNARNGGNRSGQQPASR